MTNLLYSKNISLDGKNIELVSSYRYLGDEIKIAKDKKTNELKIKIDLTRAAFGKMKDIFRHSSLKRPRVFNQCIIPVITYDVETLTLTRTTVPKL